MVVGMQSFSPTEQCQPLVVGGVPGVLGLAEAVPDGIDGGIDEQVAHDVHAGSNERQAPPEDRPKNAVPKQEPNKAAVEEEPVPLVDLDVPAVLAKSLRVFGGFFVEADVVELHFPIPVE